MCCLHVPHENGCSTRRQAGSPHLHHLTPALLELRDRLMCQGVTLVVTEAMSAYWKPPFYLPEDDIDCWVATPAMSRTPLREWPTRGSSSDTRATHPIGRASLQKGKNGLPGHSCAAERTMVL